MEELSGVHSKGEKVVVTANVLATDSRCPVFLKLQALYTERFIWHYTHTCATRAFISHTPIDKLIYQIYQLVGGFLAKMLSS